MVILREVELRRWRGLGRDRTVTGFRELHRVGVAARLRGFPLRIVVHIDAGTILRPDVVALAHALCRVMGFPERAKQLFVAGLRRVINDTHYFVVPRAPGAHLFICRVRSQSTRVTDGGAVDTRQVPEELLGAPETAEPEHRGLEARRIGRLEAVPGEEGRGGDFYPRGAGRA